MKTTVMSALCAIILLMACNKKEPQTAERTVTPVKTELPSECGTEIIADKPVKAGETGIILPVGTKLCMTKDNLEVRVELPEGFAFFSKAENAVERTLPIYATYGCYCSGQGSACNVFYADGLGFGCLQSSCTGSCTGKFTYKGYSVDRVVPTTDKTEFFSLPEVQARIRKKCGGIVTNPRRTSNPANEVYLKQTVNGVSFYLLLDRSDIPASMNNAELISPKANCDCEGTKACTLKTLGIAMDKGTSQFKIYYCDGPCNGCELTVN